MYMEFGKPIGYCRCTQPDMPGRFSSCEIFGIDAFAEADLGYAPS